MITENDVIKAIEQMRRIGTDTQRYEVKESVVGLPKSLTETISAFSNMHGGIIILGLSEKHGFKPATGFNAHRIFSQMQAIGDKLTPIVRMEIEKIIFENAELVIAYVPELPNNRKPCYISARGQYNGSFIRSGDGDRHLTPYEIDRLAEGQMQPQFDLEPVENASMSDLNKDTIKAIIKRTRELFPRIFSKLSDETILIQLGVATRIKNKVCPTLAGLLAAGNYPQRFFPRLEIVFTVYAGTTKSTGENNEKRYVTSKELVGSIPDMLIETLALVYQYMSTGAIIEGALRKDVPDYPLIAVREAVANALQHRDYSLEGRGTQVQVNMYADRLEITNPGGLYGAITVDNLGKEGISSTRNEFLSRLLMYTPYESGFVVENKGAGFMAIQSSLAQALMPPPKVQNSLTFFSLTFEKRRKSEDELSRPWEKVGEVILSELKVHGSLSVKELIEMSGLSRATIANHINKLVKEAKVEPTEVRRSPKQRYRLVRKVP